MVVQEYMGMMPLPLLLPPLLQLSPCLLPSLPQLLLLSSPLSSTLSSAERLCLFSRRENLERGGKLMIF
jgi:hypothetical protein